MKSVENSLDKAAVDDSGLQADALAMAQRAADGVAAVRHAVAPPANIWLTDAIIARIRNFATGLQQDIDGRIAVKATVPPSADQTAPLSPQLLHFLYARALEVEFGHQTRPESVPHAELPPLMQMLIEGRDDRLAALGMGFLVAQNRLLRSGQSHKLVLGDVPADICHPLAHAVAMQRRAAGASAVNVQQAIAGILSGHDETAGRPAVLNRLAHLVAENIDWAALPRPVAHFGHSLFLAILAAGQNIGFDNLLWITAESGQLRLAIFLRTAGLPIEALLQSLLDLHLPGMAAMDPRLTRASLAALSPRAARESVASWAFTAPGGA